MLGRLRDGVIDLSEIHRFANTPINEQHSIRWDVDRLWSEIRRGLELASTVSLESAAIDTWGVDYALLDARRPAQKPFHYRDARTNGAMKAVFASAAIAFTVQFLRQPICQLTPNAAMCWQRLRADDARLPSYRLIAPKTGLHDAVPGRPDADVGRATRRRCWNPDQAVRAAGRSRKRDWASGDCRGYAGSRDRQSRHGVRGGCGSAGWRDRVS